MFPDRAKWGAPGPSATKVGATLTRRPRVNLPQGHGDLLFARDSFDAFRKHPQHAGIEAVDRPRISKRLFFRKGVQLKNFFGEFRSLHRWGHGTL